MPDFLTNRKTDYLYKRRMFDKLPPEEWAKSVRETRSIYPDMPEAEFAAMYQKRWRLPAGDVLHILAGKPWRRRGA